MAKQKMQAFVFNFLFCFNLFNTIYYNKDLLQVFNNIVGIVLILKMEILFLYK